MRNIGEFSTTDDLVASICSLRPQVPVLASVQDLDGLAVSRNTVDRWLDEGCINSGVISLSRAQSATNLGDFRSDIPVQGRLWPFLISPAKVRYLYRQGHTIVLSSLDRFSPELKALRSRLTQANVVAVDLMLFVAPSGQRGFNAHRDPDDYVVTIQAEGHKRWRLYDAPPESWQISNDEQQVTGEASEELITSVGDVLVVPRGWGHEASSLETGGSVHLSIGLNFVDFGHLYRQRLVRALNNCPQSMNVEQTRSLIDSLMSDNFFDEASLLSFLRAGIEPAGTPISAD